jgi:osmoprotectant transport system substrate-binding protein
MRKSRLFVIAASVVMIMTACSAAATPSPAPATPAPATAQPTAAPSSAAPTAPPSVALPTVRIGSDNFYESKLMAEIYGQILEKAGYKVDRHLGLGSRQARQPLMEQGQVDIVPEYVGSGLGYYDKTQITGDGAKNAAALATILKTKGGGIEVFGITPAQDQNAFVVRKETADQYTLTKMSDLTAVADKLKFGVATDCPTNPVCGKALKDAYGIDVANATKLSACDTPMAQALKGKTIDVAELCSTQPDIAVNGWVVLEDDKQTQPADNIAPLVRNDLLAKLADKNGFENILNQVSAAMDTATLTDLGKQVAVDNKDIAEVAKAWLQSKSLVQ